MHHNSDGSGEHKPDRIPVLYYDEPSLLDVACITRTLAQLRADGQLGIGLAAAAGVEADAVLDLLAGQPAPRLPDLRRLVLALDLQLSDVLLPEKLLCAGSRTASQWPVSS